MNPRPFVLCPIDFSDASRSALRYAAAVSQHFFGDLTLLAVDDPLLRKAADIIMGPGWVEQDTVQELRRFFDETFADVKPVVADVRFEVATGKPGPEIVQRAREQHANLLVMSTHGLTGGAKRMFGSTADRVLRETTVPVVITPPTAFQPRNLHDIRATIGRVLAPLDLSPVSTTQLRIARGAADALGVELVIVHALAPIPWAHRLADQAQQLTLDRHREAMDALAAIQASAGGRPADRMVVREGDPAEVITDVAAIGQPCLIVRVLHEAPTPDRASARSPIACCVTARTSCSRCRQRCAFRCHPDPRTRSSQRLPQPCATLKGDDGWNTHVAGRSAGSCTVTVVPPVGGHSIASAPWCASTSRFAVGKPRPEPRALVVKNGMKIFSRISGEMPGPRSITEMRHRASVKATST
jgi:universal stress protein A